MTCALSNAGGCLRACAAPVVSALLRPCLRLLCYAMSHLAKLSAAPLTALVARPSFEELSQMLEDHAVLMGQASSRLGQGQSSVASIS